MDQIPINVVILSTIPETIVIISLGLILIGKRPPLGRVLTVALIQGLIVYFVRRNANFGLYNLILFITMTTLVWLIVKVPIYLSFLSMLIGFVINFLASGIFMLIIPKIFGFSLIEIISRSWLRVGFFIPQFFVLLLLIYLSLKNDFTLEKEIGFLGQKQKI